MGYYINPEKITKEKWLKEFGILATSFHKDAFTSKPDGMLPVVLVDNGDFSAAGICFSEDEFQAFTSPSDKRSKSLWFVLEEDLLKMCPNLCHALEREKKDG